jgi:hypothetical protein
VASSNSGDCAFEDDTCGWINPEDRDGLDDLNWERMEATKSEILQNFFFLSLMLQTTTLEFLSLASLSSLGPML